MKACMTPTFYVGGERWTASIVSLSALKAQDLDATSSRRVSRVRAVDSTAVALALRADRSAGPTRSKVGVSLAPVWRRFRQGWARHRVSHLALVWRDQPHKAGRAPA
jgi:hypothetical protein